MGSSGKIESEKSNKKRPSFTLIIALCGLLLSLWNTLWQYSEGKRSEYEENAFRFSPMLSINQITFLLPFKGDSVKLDTSSGIPTVILQLRYDTARVRIHFTNKGNAYAKLVGFGIADSASTAPILRTDIYEKDAPIEITGWRQFYQEFSAAANSNDSIETIFIVTKNPGDHGIFHIVLFYENQRNVLFDTYCWLPYRLESPRSGRLENQAIPGGFKIHYAESNAKLSDQLIKIEDKRLDYKSYTKDEAEKFSKAMIVKK